MKDFYNSLNEVYGPSSTSSSPLLCANGTKLISKKDNILERKVKHFDSELNRPYSINDKAIE